MAFLVSPGVQVIETDLTNLIPSVSTSVGGFVGAFGWGPVNSPVLISSEPNLASVFSTPNAANASSYWTAASFLLYGNALQVVRALGGTVGGTTSLNATSGHSGLFGILIQNQQQYQQLYSTAGIGSVGSWAALYPGALGNSIGVYVCPASAAGTAFTSWAALSVPWSTSTVNFASLFAAAPTTTASAASAGSSYDELHIVVVDTTGLISGTVGTVLETYPFVSLATDSLNADGTSNYYVNQVNNKSRWIAWLNHDTTYTAKGGASVFTASVFSTYTSPVSYIMQGGTDVAMTTQGEVNGLAFLSDPSTININLLFALPDASGNTVANALLTTAQNRKDCVAFVSAPVSFTSTGTTPLASLTAWRGALSPGSTSYGFMDSTSVLYYDKYNDVYVWTAACGHMAGLCAATDASNDPWWSPAGYNRGNLLNVTKLGYNPVQADRDTLYLAGINPIVSFPGQGPILFGDKTLQTKPSAFDRINVRRLFITLEKAISLAAKYQLFEFNDSFTQAMFRNMTEPFLRDVQGRRGITAFQVVCDSTNNTPAVVNSNQFVGTIYIAPARSINFITLNFIATRTGVSFTELAGTPNNAA